MILHLLQLQQYNVLSVGIYLHLSTHHIFNENLSNEPIVLSEPVRTCGEAVQYMFVFRTLLELSWGAIFSLKALIQWY